jgi:hypothetical protein
VTEEEPELLLARLDDMVAGVGEGVPLEGGSGGGGKPLFFLEVRSFSSFESLSSSILTKTPLL